MAWVEAYAMRLGLNLGTTRGIQPKEEDLANSSETLERKELGQEKRYN